MRIAKIKILIAIELAIIFFTASLTAAETPFVKVLSPSKGIVWEEGKTYEITWKSQGIKKVCIEVLMGGKDRGNLDECQIDASKGHYTWHIPKGFVSGFGIDKEDQMKIFICNPQETVCGESPFFTITKPLSHFKKIHYFQEKLEPEFVNTIKNYFQAIVQKQYAKAYELLLKNKITIYVGRCGLSFMPRPPYQKWVRAQKGIQKLEVLKIEPLPLTKERYLLGIRTYKVEVSIALKPNNHWSIPSGKQTFFVDLIKGTDSQIRILGIGNGP